MVILNSEVLNDGKHPACNEMIAMQYMITDRKTTLAFKIFVLDILLSSIYIFYRQSLTITAACAWCCTKESPVLVNYCLLISELYVSPKPWRSNHKYCIGVLAKSALLVGFEQSAPNTLILPLKTNIVTFNSKVLRRTTWCFWSIFRQLKLSKDLLLDNTSAFNDSGPWHVGTSRHITHGSHLLCQISRHDRQPPGDRCKGVCDVAIRSDVKRCWHCEKRFDLSIGSRIAWSTAA